MPMAFRLTTGDFRVIVDKIAKLDVSPVFMRVLKAERYADGMMRVAGGFSG